MKCKRSNNGIFICGLIIGLYQILFRLKKRRHGSLLQENYEFCFFFEVFRKSNMGANKKLTLFHVFSRKNLLRKQNFLNYFSEKSFREILLFVFSRKIAERIFLTYFRSKNYLPTHYKNFFLFFFFFHLKNCP